MGRREQTSVCQIPLSLSGERVKFRDPIYLISEEFYPYSIIKCRHRNDLQHIPTHPKCTSLQIHIIPVILYICQLIDDLIPVLYHAHSE